MKDSENNLDIGYDVPWPQNGDTLVTDNGDDGLAQTMSQGQWETYVFSYRRAAEILVERIEAEPVWVNFMVFPIVFLYRHYLELRLKTLIWDGDAMDAQPARRLDNEHGLTSLWHELRPILEKRFSDCPQSELDAVEQVLREFGNLDPKSQAARYPIDKSGNPCNLLGIKINLKKFAETITRAANFLDSFADEFTEDDQGNSC